MSVSASRSIPIRRPRERFRFDMLDPLAPFARFAPSRRGKLNRALTAVTFLTVPTRRSSRSMAPAPRWGAPAMRAGGADDEDRGEERPRRVFQAELSRSWPGTNHRGECRPSRSSRTEGIPHCGPPRKSPRLRGSAPKSPPERGAADNPRTLHHHQSGALQMLDKALRHDFRHDLVGVVHALAALKAQREGERIGEIVRIGWRQLVEFGHVPTIAQRRERNKNEWDRVQQKSGRFAQPLSVR